MNNLLTEFINSHYKRPGTALDLGAGDFNDVKKLRKVGWVCDGVDLKTGVDLEKPYISPNGNYGLIFSNFVIHKITNKEVFLATIINNIKKGGWIFILTFDKSDKNSNSNLDKDYFMKYLNNDFSEIEVKNYNQYDNDPGHNHTHKVLIITARKK